MEAYGFSILGIGLTRRQVDGGMNTTASHGRDETWVAGEVPDILLTPRARRRKSAEAATAAGRSTAQSPAPARAGQPRFV